MKTYLINEALIQAIGSYLITRPWAEVNGLLVELQRQTTPQPIPEEDEPE